MWVFVIPRPMQPIVFIWARIHLGTRGPQTNGPQWKWAHMGPIAISQSLLYISYTMGGALLGDML